MEWYYADANENQLGPISEAQVTALVSGGTITGKTMVWQEGMAEWLPAEATTLNSMLPRTAPPSPGQAPRNVPPKLGTSGSFDRDDSKVYPQNPPRSAHLNWLNLLGPGLAQIVYGKLGMGICGVALTTILFVTPFNVLNIAILIVSVVDGIMTARVLQQGRPVGKWQFFPR